jgi:hypothetical protein
VKPEDWFYIFLLVLALGSGISLTSAFERLWWRHEYLKYAMSMGDREMMIHAKDCSFKEAQEALLRVHSPPPTTQGDQR